jgi:hypothetical protein
MASARRFLDGCWAACCCYWKSTSIEHGIAELTMVAGVRISVAGDLQSVALCIGEG